MRKMIVLVGLGLIFQASALWAHCDTYDGPVIKAAQEALKNGNVNLVLIWVPEKDESQIVNAFKDARKSGKNQAFFEKLVKVHREGEGVQYTGLKPAGTPIDPAIAAADQAIAEGKVDPALPHVSAGHRKHVEHAFSRVMRAKKYQADDLKAGRKYVAAYVEFVHLVEGHH